jgi:hypothetical protein
MLLDDPVPEKEANRHLEKIGVGVLYQEVQKITVSHFLLGEIPIRLPIRKNAVLIEEIHVGIKRNLEKVLLNPVVTVNESQPLAIGILYSDISRRTDTSILFMEYADAAVLFGISITELTASILAAVIDQQEFKVRKTLAQYTVETTGKMLFRIIYRNDY